MCRLFIGADERLWESRTKSLRIEGAVTSVRLENFFWRSLEDIAFRDGMSIAQLLEKLYVEALDAGHDIANFTSFLRVCCGRYMTLIAEGEISPSWDDPLSDVDAEAVLQRERERNGVCPSVPVS